jgi:hypothetical protein
MAFYALDQHEYRYKPAGGAFTAWAPVTVKPIPLSDIAIAAGDLQVRVKADPASNRLAGAILASSTAFTAVPVENTTPAAPGVTADDTANTLSFTHALGTGEIVVSINNGTYAAYAGPYAVGDVARVAGYYKAKVKAATGRNESAVTNSPAFTVVPPANVAPVANAGTDGAITLPTSSIALTGSGTDSDGTIASYLWEQTIGPVTGTIANVALASTTVTGLTTAGTYVFRLTVTDNQGATHQDTVQIVVNPVPVPVISSFSPTSAPEGSSVTITGVNLTGATSLLFNGVAATFTVLSDTEINATVPAATTGAISVTTPNGTDTSDTVFTVLVNYKLIIDGNSIPAGYLGYDFQGKLTALLPPALADNSLPGSFDSVVNWAVSAQTTVDMESDAATQIDPSYNAAKITNVLFVWEVTNHLYFGATAQQAYDALKAYCEARKAAHPAIKIAVGTVLPRTNSGTPAGFEAARLAVNPMIQNAKFNGEPWLDAVADFALDTSIGETGDSANTTYYHDLVHLNDTGLEIAAEIAKDAIMQAAFGITPRADLGGWSVATALPISGTGNITATAGVLSPTPPVGANGTYLHKDITGYKFPANTDGWVGFYVNSIQEGNAVLGVNTANVAVRYPDIEAGMWIPYNDANAIDGEIYTLSGGAAVATGSVTSSGTYLKLQRELGFWKVYRSQDGESWDLVKKLVYSSQAEHFVVINMDATSTLYFVKGVGVIPV